MIITVVCPARERPDHGPRQAPVQRLLRGSDRGLPAPRGLTWYAGDPHNHCLHSDPAPRPEIYVTFRIKTPREVPFFNPAERFSRIPSDSGEPSYLWVALHSSEFGKKRGSLYCFARG